MKRIKKILLIISLCFLPYFTLITYEYFSNNFRILTYSQELLYLLIGPIKLALLDPKILLFHLGSNEINPIAVIPLMIMLFSISIGLWKFNKSYAYKILFAIGMLIWFGFGVIAVGIHYLTT